METLIQSRNFVHDDEKVENSFRNAFSELTTDESKIGVEDVVKCLQSLGDKLTADSKPEPDTKGWEMAHWAFKQILYMARNLSETNKSKDIGKIFYLFVFRLLDSSLNILHVVIAYECLYEGDIHVKEYIKSLDKDNLTSLLTVVCKPVKSKETIGRNYANSYYKWINELLKDTLTASQVKEFFTFLLDYAVYCYLDSISLPEEMYRKMTDTGQMVLSALDNPFSSFDDIEKIKTYIRRCTDLFQSPTYAPNKTVSRYALEFMERKMMKELGKQGKLEDLYSEIFDLLMAISKCTYTLEGDKYLFELFYGAQVYFSNFETKSPTKNASVFENIVKRFITVVQDIDMKFLNHYRFAYSVVDNALKKLYANDKQKSRSWVSMLVPLLKRPCESTVRACYTITSENKAIKWKEHKDIVDQVLENFQSFQPPSSTQGLERKQKEEIKEYLDYFKRTAEYFFDGLK
ncbi:hypothetical protein Btru_051988 [Bulinus truncatus]|nr:hypothetical protein Btru_051988 [Bulinus truncatus]